MEIWEQILFEVIDVPITFDTTCEPIHFNLFVADKLREWRNPRWYESERDRKTIKQVCEAWRAIISSRDRRHVDDYLKWELTRGVWRVDVRPSWSQRFGVSDDSFMPSWREKENTASLSTVSIQAPFNKDTESTFTTLFGLASNLSSVRSFIYSGNHEHITPPILRGLESHYSTLTTLFITSDWIEGPLSLQHLQVLYIDARITTLTGWWFPSLRHIALGRKYMDGMYQTELVPAPANKLESILLPFGHLLLSANLNFWNAHPSLQFLGVSSQAFEVVDSPPSSHPMSHLFFLESRNYINRLDITRVRETFQRMPTLRTVTMPPDEDMQRDNMYSAKWLELFRARKETGLIWLDGDGKEIVFRAKWLFHFPLWACAMFGLLDLYGLVIVVRLTVYPRWVGVLVADISALGTLCYFYLYSKKFFDRRRSY